MDAWAEVVLVLGGGVDSVICVDFDPATTAGSAGVSVPQAAERNTSAAAIAVVVSRVSLDGMILFHVFMVSD